MRLAGRVALVTGGARGIGKAIAAKLAREGGDVVIADILEEELRATETEFQGLGLAVTSTKMDVTSGESVREAFARVVEQRGRLDILVNNAGVTVRCPSEDLPEVDWDRVMNVNLKGVFLCCQVACRQMKRQGGGSIVNISSAAYLRTLPRRAAYCISKGAVATLTAVLGAEWAEYGIRVNGVAPGWILTDMVKKGLELGAIRREEVEAITPLGRFADAAEIADAVCYLASDEASFVTGQTLLVDGGWNALGVPRRLDGGGEFGSDAAEKLK